MINANEFIGTEWVWWVGVVKNINDLTNMGRVQVRIFGFHTADTSVLPDEKLPWAQQIMPTTSASFSGTGTSPTGLQVNSWVIGFFMDGRKGQFPVVFGTFHGVHSTSSSEAYGSGNSSSGSVGGSGGTGGGSGGTGVGSGAGAYSARKDGYENGKIPRGKLVSIGRGHFLYGPAATQYLKMEAAAKQENITWGITDSYRSYEGQVDVARRKGLYSQGGLAATPGTSRHGWGEAVDLTVKRGDAGHTWLTKNAHRFGFETIPREPWHWQFNGTVGNEDSSTQSHSPPAESRSTPNQSPNKLAAVTEPHKNDERSFTQLIKGADASSWTIPDSPDISSYPRNTVHRDPSGNLLAMSYQPGGERVALVHGKSGSYLEIDSNGNMVLRADGDTFNHSKGNLKISAEKHLNLAAQKGAIRLYAPDKVALETQGSISLSGQRDFDLAASGGMVIKVGGPITIDAESIKFVAGTGGIDFRSEGNINMEAHGEFNASAKDTMALESENMMMKSHGTWTAHATGKATLGSDGDASIKSDGKIKVEGSEYHNASAKAGFKKLSSTEFKTGKISWGSTDSVSPDGPAGAGASENVSPEAADKPLDNISSRAKELTQAAEAGEQVKGAGTNYGKRSKGGVARSAEANPVVPNPRPKPNDASTDANWSETPKARPHYMDVQYQQYDSATVGESPNEATRNMYTNTGDSDKGGYEGGGGGGSGGVGTSGTPGGAEYTSNLRGTPYDSGVAGYGDVFSDTNQSSMGSMGVPLNAMTTPIKLMKITNSEQQPSKQLTDRGSYYATPADVEGIRKASQVIGNVPRSHGAAAIIQKSVENGPNTNATGFAGTHPINRGTASWFGQYGYRPYGEGKSQYVWKDDLDNGKNASGLPQTVPGIALPEKTLKKYYNVKAPNGRMLRLIHIDDGPRNDRWKQLNPGKSNKSSVKAGIDINAPAAELFGYTPTNFPTGRGVWEWQLAEDQTPGPDNSYPQRIARTEATSRAFQSVTGRRPPTVLAGVASAKGYSPNVIRAWGLSFVGGRWGRSINWLLKNTKGAELAGWQEFAKRYKGKVHDPSYAPQELIKMWVNTLGAPWASLAGGMIDKLGIGEKFNVESILSGKNPLGSLLPALIEKNVGITHNTPSTADVNAPNEPAIIGTANTVDPSTIKSEVFEYNPKDGSDATTAIKLMKELYSLDSSNEEWTPATFAVNYSDMPDFTSEIPAAEHADELTTPNLNLVIRPFKLDITVNSGTELKYGMPLSDNISLDALTTGPKNPLTYPFNIERIEHLIEDDFFTSEYLAKVPANLRPLYTSKWKIAQNLQHLAQGAIEPLVDAYGTDVKISTAFINSGLNSLYPISRHGTGESIDIYLPDYEINMFHAVGEIMKILKNRNVIEIGLCYNQRSWIHIGIAGGFNILGGTPLKPRYFTRDFATGECWSGFFPARGLMK